METFKQKVQNKILSLILFLTLIITLFPSFSNNTALAASNSKVNIIFSVSKTSVVYDEIFTVSAIVTNKDTAPITVTFSMDDMWAPGSPNGKSGISCATPASQACTDTNAWQFNNLALAVGQTKTVSQTFLFKKTTGYGTSLPGTYTFSGPFIYVNNVQDTTNFNSLSWTATISNTVAATPTVIATTNPSTIPTKKPIVTSTPPIATQTPSTAPILTVTPTTFSQSIRDEFYCETCLTLNLETLSPDALKSIPNFTLNSKSGNKIVFKDNVDLSGVNLNDMLANSILISNNGVVEIKSDKISQLNKPATITMTGLTFTRTPKILHNGGDSSSYVSNINYNLETGILTFDVTGFSKYEAVENLERSNPSERITNSNLNNLFVIIFSTIVAITLSSGGLYWYYNKRKAK